MMLDKKEVLGLEEKYWDAMRSNDVDTAVSLTKFPCMMTSPKGVQSIGEAQYRQIMQRMKGDEYKDVEIQDPQVTVLNEDAALIAYSTELNGMHMVNASTWVKTGDKWVCAFHSETPLQ